MLLSMAQSNPALFQMISDRATVARQLDKLSRLKDLMETSQEELIARQAEEWGVWITRYRLAMGTKDVSRQFSESIFTAVEGRNTDCFLQAASGSGGGGPEQCPGGAGGETEGDGQH